MTRTMYIAVAGVVGLCMTPMLADDAKQTDLAIEFDASGLTIVHIDGRTLDCTYHTSRKDNLLAATMQSMKAYDTHHSVIMMTDAEMKEIAEWADKACLTTITEEQRQPNQRGYSTHLLISRKGARFFPDHAMSRELLLIVRRIVNDRRQEFPVW